MSPQNELTEVTQRWLQECASSDVGLWWLADDIRQQRPQASEQEIRVETLRALRPLLERGLLRAVRLMPGGGFEPWTGSTDEQLARIDREWTALGRSPDIGDIVWFIGARADSGGA